MTRKLLLGAWFFVAVLLPINAHSKIRVVTTLPDYADIARAVGGDLVEVDAIVPPGADAHFVRPKPSYAMKARRADLFVATGLDLELWAPVLLERAGNRAIMEGGPGYVAAAKGVQLLEKPVALDRSAGDIHVFGNPHIHTSPINVMQIAANIAEGLCRVDAGNCDVYQANLARYTHELAKKLYGARLMERYSLDTLNQLARQGALFSWLEERGEQDLLGGWLKEAEPLRGKRVICYHKNWIYLSKLLGFKIVEYLEPKPGIPPTPAHVSKLMKMASNGEVDLILMASHYEKKRPRAISKRTGVPLVVVPFSVGAERGIESYFDLVECWISRMVSALGGGR